VKLYSAKAVPFRKMVRQSSFPQTPNSYPDYASSPTRNFPAASKSCALPRKFKYSGFARRVRQWHFLPAVFALFHAFPLGNPLYLWYFTTTPRAVLRIRLGIVSEIRETQLPLRFCPDGCRSWRLPCAARQPCKGTAKQVNIKGVGAGPGVHLDYGTWFWIQ